MHKENNKWIRYKEQEKDKVYRWYEKKDIIASVVQGYFEKEANIRITGPNFDAIEVRGHKMAILDKTDEELYKAFDRYIKEAKKK